MSIFTAGALGFHPLSPSSSVFVASLLVSLLSTAYGLYVHIASTAEGRHGILPRGARLQLFLCILVHVTWILAACGTLLATDPLGSIRWVALGTIQVIGAAGVWVTCMEAGYGLVIKVFFSITIGPLFAILDGIFFAPMNDDSLHTTNLFIGYCPALRRLLLLMFAALSLAADFSWRRCALLCALSMIDLLGSIRLFTLAGLFPDRRSFPKLQLVDRKSPHRCVFASSRGTESSPILLEKPRGLAIIAATDEPVTIGSWNSMPLAVGAAADAISVRMEGSLLVCDSVGGNGTVFGVNIPPVRGSKYRVGHRLHLRAEIEGKHKEAGKPGKPSSRDFIFNDEDGTISPVAAPELVLGVQFARATYEASVDAEMDDVLSEDMPLPRRQATNSSFPDALKPLYDAFDELAHQLAKVLGLPGRPRGTTRSPMPVPVAASEQHQRALYNVSVWLLQATAGTPLAFAGDEDALLNILPHGMCTICEAKDALLDMWPNGILSVNEVARFRLMAALVAYMPISSDGVPERELIAQILCIAAMPEPGTAQSEQPSQHPMRAVSLSKALSPAVWQMAPSKEDQHGPELETDVGALLLATERQLEEPIRMRLRDGTIRLLKCDWLIDPRAKAFLNEDLPAGSGIINSPDGTALMRRRQDLPPEAFFSPKEAERLYAAGTRSVLVLS